MAMAEQKAPQQTGDNPNKPGQGPNKGDLSAGDIEWVKPPQSLTQGRGATSKGLSKGQRRDLASRIRAKLSRKG
jgi:hypothetical protein